MAEFCECGSLLIGGRCSNKSCSLRGGNSPVTGKKSTVRSKSVKGTLAAAKTAAKPVNPRKASKVVTYNLYDLPKKEPEAE